MMEPSIEELILNGIVEVAGIDPNTGEFLYNFTPMLQELMPDMWNEKLDTINKEIMFFWQLGFLQIDNMGSRNPLISLTEKAVDQEAILQLPEEKQVVFEELKKLFER